jgi:hypothetical protein
VDRAPQYVFGVGWKTGDCQLGRDVDHGFETIRAVFDGLEQCATASFEVAAIHRGNRACARGLAIVGLSAAAFDQASQSGSKHATENVDGNRSVLSDRADELVNRNRSFQDPYAD